MLPSTSKFAKKSAPLLGLDISSSSIKLVELGQGKNQQMILERCGIEPLETGWVVDGGIEKFDEVAQAIQQLLKKTGARTKNVAMALPASAVITKKIVLPANLSEQELEVQVEAEANQYIPFSLDEVSLDFCVIGPHGNSATSNGSEIDVLIAASRKEKVQDRQGLAEAAGLKPVIVDIESYASRLAALRFIEAMPDQGRDALVALFEVGAFTTSMQVVRNGEVLYERDQAFGGLQLTQLIVRQYGFSQEEAEAKKRSGELPEGHENVVLKPFVESLVQEFGRALQFFYTSTPHNQVNCILIAGGTAAVPGLSTAVAEACHAACRLVNPFDGMTLGSAVRENRLQREAPAYLTACGLAMRRFL